MNSSAFLMKVLSSVVIANFLNKLGVAGYLGITLGILMIMDFITGILAAAHQKINNPEDESLGVSSKKAKQGAIGKAITIILVGLCLVVDHILAIVGPEMGLEVLSAVNFTFVILVYYNGTEIVSIVENATKASSKDTPAWLKAFVNWLSGTFGKYIAKKLAEISNGEIKETEEDE